MDHDLFQELMRSPLDEPPPRLPRWFPALGLFAAAALLGALAGLALGADDPVPATTPTTPGTVPEAVEVHGLPEGYVDTGLGYGLRAESLFVRGEIVYVAVSSAVPSDADPAASAPLGEDRVLGSTRRALGAWALRLTDGAAIDFTRERFDPDAPGMVTVEFPAGGVSVEDVVGLELRPLAGSGLRSVETEVPVDAVPLALEAGAVDAVPASERVAHLDSGVVERSVESWLEVDSLVADWDYGAVTWRLQGAPDVAVMVSCLVTFEGEGVDEQDRASLLSASQMPPTFLQRPQAPDSPARAGTTYLLVPGRAVLDRYQVTSLRFEWTVSWARYGDEVLELPFVVAADDS